MHKRVFLARGRRKTRTPHERVFFLATLHSYGCGFERTRLMRCHGINRLDDGFPQCIREIRNPRDL